MSVKTFSRIFFAGVVLFFFFFSTAMIVSLAKRANAAYKGHEKFVAAASSSWTPFYSTAGNFSILFPDSPIHSGDEVPFLNDSSVTLYDSYTAKDAEDFFYTVIVVRYPSQVLLGDAGSVIERVMNEIVRDIPGSEIIDFYVIEGSKGLAGYEFIVHSSGTATHYRALVDFRTLYIMSVASSSLALPEKRALHFFDSFHVMI